MRRLVDLIILFSVLSACHTAKYISPENIKTEYKVRDMVRSDSMYQKDSVYIFTQSDTVYKTKITYLYHYITINKSDTVLKIDSILTPYPVEKQLTEWQSIKIEVGGWALGFIIITIIVFSLKLIRK